jgi:glycine cleavage system T protein (aminomethyltransferase)
MPVQYEGIIDEHRAVRSRAGIFDVCHMAEFRVFGFHALEALQHLVASDLARIDDVGAAQYTVMLDETGGVIDDLIVYHTGDLEYLVIANAGNHDVDVEWIQAHLPAGVEFVDESDRTGLIALQGPEAVRIITELGGEAPPARFHVSEAMLDGSVPVLLARTGYTGEDGVEIVCAAADAVTVWRLLLSFPEVTPCGLGARDTLRLEMGYPLHGSDMDRTTDPISAGLSWVVSATKGDYIGREAVERVRAAGPKHRLVGMAVLKGIPRHGHPVLHEGSEVGTVASGTFSPTLGHGIATAYVPVALAEPGTVLEVSIRGKTTEATVTRPPFVTRTSLSA